MKKTLAILFIFSVIISAVRGQNLELPDFNWGNASYFNININESIFYNDYVIKLLKIENSYNQFKIGTDTIWIKVSRRTLPVQLGNMRIFVADNKCVKALDSDKEIHSLLKKDALICVSNSSLPLLDNNNYHFPVSFNDGFIWNAEEDSYMFSFTGLAERKSKETASHTGVDFDLSDARGIKKHWIIAIEDSKVVWVEDKNPDQAGKQAAVLLESESQPGIYYFYKFLNKSTIEIKNGQKLLRGEIIGTAWGDEIWGHLTFSVIKSDSIPVYQKSGHSVVNCFPQMFELYYKQTTGFLKSFTKGRLYFGKKRSLHGNQKNTAAYEAYTGKGWILGKWNKADKVDWISKGEEGNVRLGKKIFAGTTAECTNPYDFYEYEINVPSGVYRIRARMGDIALPTWQKISYEGVEAGDLILNAGQFAWTPEKIVKVEDGRLTVRIFVDPNNEKPAGMSEIVFQQAYKLNPVKK